MLKVGELKIYVGVRADKRNTRSQGHCGATRSNDTFRCLKRGKVRKVMLFLCMVLVRILVKSGILPSQSSHL